MKNETTISVMDAMRDTTMNVTVHVVGIRLLRFRLWIGVRLIKLASMVMGCDIEFKNMP